MEQRRLFKDINNKMIFGICSGIAKYFNIDPTIVRLIAVFLGLSGTGILIYLIAAIIIPEEPRMF